MELGRRQAAREGKWEVWAERGHFPSHGRADGEVGLWRTYLQDRGMDGI